MWSVPIYEFDAAEFFENLFSLLQLNLLFGFRSNKQSELDRRSPSEFSDHVEMSSKDIEDSPSSRSTMNCSPEFDVCRSKERLPHYIYDDDCR